MHKITVLPGDGIGVEIMGAALLVLDTVARRVGFHYELKQGLIGGAALDVTGEPLPQETIDLCKSSDAVLLGAVGDPKWDGHPSGKRPEQGILGIRKELQLFANLRPVLVYNSLREASPLKNEIIGDGLDLLFVRELTGGIYFGERGRRTVDDAAAAYDTEQYSVPEIERIARVAFDAAKLRAQKLCSVDKANVLESSRLWRETVNRLQAAEYPEVEVTHMYVDNAAMQLVRAPRQFDVILTSNLFGDILSDEASQISGSIGLLPSASLGSGKLGLYEPIHGSAPDIAGQNKANPIATILSVAMMLRYSLGELTAAQLIEDAVEQVLEEGARTVDLQGGNETLGTAEMSECIAAIIY